MASWMEYCLYVSDRADLNEFTAVSLKSKPNRSQKSWYFCFVRVDAVLSAKYWLYSLNSFPTAKLCKMPDKNSIEGLTAMKEKIQKSFVTESNTKVFTQFSFVTSQDFIRSYDSLMSSFETSGNAQDAMTWWKQVWWFLIKSRQNWICSLSAKGSYIAM